jgi:4-oxalocrotonate tautomerase
MSWLDLTLEDNPESFDCCFDTTWDELSENQRQERMNAIRKVL